VKDAVMSRRFSPVGCLMLLRVLTAPGAATAEAADIWRAIGVHAQNIPRAVAGGYNPHVGAGAGAQAPSQLNPNTRSIQPGGADESMAIKSPKTAIVVNASRRSAAPQGRR
jgi:hypothetical protein